MDVSETLLPGVGIRYEFRTRGRQHIAVIVYRDGDAEVVEFDASDPDSTKTLLELDEDEGEVLAEILGASRISRRLVDLTREIPGLHSEPVRLAATSAYVGRTLGETRCRTLTGSSIVAIVRGEDVISSPTPDQLLLAGDVLVAIGTASGVRKVRALLELSQ